MPPPKHSAWTRFVDRYNKFADWSVEDLFNKKKVSGPPRTVYVNQDLPQDYYDAKGRVKKEHIYCTNQVVTSKYTIVTFLPRNLLEQFRRIANIFFLAINILQFFSIFSTISPGLVILPLLIVLALAAGKDGYEDIQRHRSDRHVNLSRVRVLNGGGWTNPNVTQGKSKGLTRDLFPWLPTFKKGASKSKSRKQVTQAHSEYEAGTGRGAGPDTQSHAFSMADGSTIHDVEFDHDTDLGHASMPGSPSAPHRQSTSIPMSPSQHERQRAQRKRDLKLPHWRRTAWEDVRVGDFVKILNEEAIPADVLICATSEEENVCYVETKNLDGETNLKSRNAVPALTRLCAADACADPAVASFRIDLDRPEPNMYKLDAAVTTADGKTHAVDLSQVLLRGTVLKNTKWVIGVVLFTGEDTKIVQNAGGTPSKRSKVERQMNPQVFFNLVILAVMAVVCGIVDSSLEKYYYPRGAPWLVGDNRSDDNPSINGLTTFAFALITFQNIVPISLYISIEAVRTVQAAFIYFDKEIWYDKTDQPTLARSWNLSDDLGQIEYVFSDKTGTLTQNSMVFRHCSIGGTVYKGEDVVDKSIEIVKPASSENVGEPPIDVRLSTASGSDTSSPSAKLEKGPEKESPPPDPLEAPAVALSKQVLTHFRNAQLKADLENSAHAEAGTVAATQARTLNGFFTVLALCHTVIAVVDPETKAIEYRAQSPDEAALVQAAADAGFVFRGRDREIMRLQTPFSDQIEKYELMHVLEFTSARKRMSVILRKLDDEDSRIFLLTKGADNVIFERLKPGVNEDLKATTSEHLDQFASEGLRTLTLAYKVVPDDYYNDWVHRYDAASSALQDREAKVAAVSDEIEHDLRLLGATAIEDRLQDGVPETIADLKRAGIKVWVLTGDKLETAIAIGYSTNLIASDSNLIVIRGDSDGGVAVYQQLYNAIEEFFPERRILEEEGLMNEKYAGTASNAENGEPYPLRRVNTGVSSLVGRDNGDRPGGFILVIEGIALDHAFASDASNRLLLRLGMECEAVICCRVSPLQKALVVKLVKDNVGAMTLAIGDGANDVSMIQAADVGVGIIGEEGLQAVNSSDYAIGQFRFLKRLLLVHGQWSYARNGNMIVNFFYKNLICIGVLWWFQIYCAWSSQYVFEYTYLLFWNVFWTIAPVIAIGLFDRIVDDDILMELPELYRYGRERYWFGNKIFLLYMLDAVYQSAVIFFFVNYAYFSPTARPDGYGVAQYEYATTMVIATVMAANLFNGLNTAAWTGWVFFAVFIGIILVWAYTAIYSIIRPGWFYVPVYGNDHYLFRSALFWLSLPLAICLSLVPRYLYNANNFMFNPTDIDKFRWIRKVDPSRRTREELLGELPPQLKKHMAPFSPSRRSLARGSRTDMSTGLRSVHRGFDFSQEEGGVAIQRIQTNLSERRQNLNGERPTSKGGRRRRSGSGTHHFFSLRRSQRKKNQQPTVSEQ